MLKSPLTSFLKDFANQKIDIVQLNEYETAPYFLQLSQNLTWDCLLMFLPEFAWSEPEIVLFWCSKQFYVSIRQRQSSLGKNTEIKKQLHVKFWFNRKNMSHIYIFSCKDFYIVVWNSTGQKSLQYFVYILFWEKRWLS